MLLPITTIYKPDGDRWYQNTSTKDEVPGVSSIVDMLPKPALSSWAAKLAAEYAMEHAVDLPNLILEDPVRAKGMIQGASARFAEKAAKEGTMVHHYCEIVARGIRDGVKPKAERMPPIVMPYLKSYVKFIKEFDVMPVMIESVVWDTEVGYAGRLDMACQLRSIDNSIVIVDTKSGASGVWESVSLQQTAYAYASHYYDEENDKLIEMPEITATYALWLRPEGFALIPVDSTETEWEQFKRLRGSLEWKRTRAKKVIKPAINKTPIKRQWRG